MWNWRLFHLDAPKLESDWRVLSPGKARDVQSNQSEEFPKICNPLIESMTYLCDNEWKVDLTNIRLEKYCPILCCYQINNWNWNWKLEMLLGLIGWESDSRRVVERKWSLAGSLLLKAVDVIRCLELSKNASQWQDKRVLSPYHWKKKVMCNSNRFRGIS